MLYSVIFQKLFSYNVRAKLYLFHNSPEHPYIPEAKYFLPQEYSVGSLIVQSSYFNNQSN